MRFGEIQPGSGADVSGSGGSRALLDLEAGQQQDGNPISAVCRILYSLGGNDGTQPLFYGRNLICGMLCGLPGAAGNAFHFSQADRRRCICNYVCSCLRRARLRLLTPVWNGGEWAMRAVSREGILFQPALRISRSSAVYTRKNVPRLTAFS